MLHLFLFIFITKNKLKQNEMNVKFRAKDEKHPYITNKEVSFYVNELCNDEEHT